MSLNTLLEAAEFLECGDPGEEKTREGTGRDFHSYSKSSPPGYASDGSNDNGFGKCYSSNEDSKDKRRSGGAGTREVHNKLEKNRRAHLKECFDTLKYQVPSIQDKKTSNLTILRGALRYIQTLRRKERDFEQEMQKWAHEKITLQQRLHTLKVDLTEMNIDVDLDVWATKQDQETASTSTASENGSMMGSDGEDMEILDVQPKPEVPKPPPVSLASTSRSIPNIVTPTTVARPKLLNAAIMAPVAPPSYRTPVTQILHQTITQRAAMQQLQLLQKQQLQQQQHLQQQQKEIHNKVTTVQTNSIRPTAQLFQSLPQSRTQQVFPGGVSVQAKMVPFNAQITAMSKLASAINMPISSTPKTVGQTFTIPISSATTTPTSMVAMGTTSTSSYVQPVVKTTNSIAALTVTPTVSTPTVRLGIVGNTPINQALTASLMNHGIANHNTATVMPTNIKQILNAPGAHLMSTGPQLTAINTMRTSTLGQMLSTVTNVGGVTLAGANRMSGVHPVVTLAHITPGQTHIMSPVSLVSPNVHVSTLSQQQINTMIQQQPLLKSLNQLPLLQPQFLQAGQVVNPQMVKPLMLVPSSTGQSSQMAVSVTQTKS